MCIIRSKHVCNKSTTSRLENLDYQKIKLKTSRPIDFSVKGKEKKNISFMCVDGLDVYVYNIVSISLGEFVEFLFKEAKEKKSFSFYGYCYICVTSMGTTYRLCVYRKYFRFSFNNKTKFCHFFLCSLSLSLSILYVFQRLRFIHTECIQIQYKKKVNKK